MPIVILFGPDGGGKTTLAGDVLLDVRKTRPARRSWMRGSHTLASVIATFMSRFQFFSGTDNPYYHLRLPRSMARGWEALEVVSALPVVIFRYILPSTLGMTVIADRYVPDLVVWISLTTGNDDFLDSFGGRFLAALANKADVRVFVTSDEATLVSRRGEDQREFLHRQIPVYRELARRVGALELDTSSVSTEEAVQTIIAQVNRGRQP